MTNLMNATLVLRSHDLPTVDENSSGLMDGYVTNMTWKNIDLRTVLGPMYNEYDTFNLSLNSISTSKCIYAMQAGVQGFANNDYDNLNVMVNMQGLPFINQTYDCKKQSNTNNTVIATFGFPNQINASQSQKYFNSNLISFGKSQDTVSLNIFYTRISDNLPVETQNSFPEVVIIFNIFGIDKAGKNSSRM